MRERPSVLMIREWEQQMSSSGCCGRLEGDFLQQKGEPVFAERRAAMESLGPLYQALKRRFGGRVEMQIIDPRNFVTLVALLIRDFRAHRVRFGVALRTLFSVPTQGVVVNGRIFTRGEWPSVREMTVLLDELTSSEAEAARRT